MVFRESRAFIVEKTLTCHVCNNIARNLFELNLVQIIHPPLITHAEKKVAFVIQ